MSTIFNKEICDKFFDMRAQRRIDLISLGDSNELFGGHGRNHGWGYAFATAGVPIYRTELISAAEGQNLGSNLGYRCNHPADSGRLNRYRSAPADLDMYMPDQGNYQDESGQWAPPHNYWYLAAGDSYVAGNMGLTVNAAHPLGVDTNLRGHFIYAELKEAGTGAIRPLIRRGSSPFTELALASAVINPAGKSENRIVRTTLDVAAAVRGYDIQVRWHNGANPVVGPMMQLYQWLESVDKTTGIGIHTLLGRGGQGYPHYLTSLRRSPKATKLFLEEATYGQNVPVSQRVALISLNSGLNETTMVGKPSVGPIGGLASGTAAGFADNLAGMILYFEQVWALMGGARQNLYFCLFDSTPTANPDSASLISYRDESRKLCRRYQNCFEVDLTFEQPTIETNAAAWYNSSGADRFHMTQTGYQEVFNLAVTRMLA
ncbi:hypothetical protein EKK58_02090 [Candidatus Dependentiae bacterium]|nr:MAG: hypothetical protein EKK58_02090 [Candidatus Dependentiae bacterium]